MSDERGKVFVTRAASSIDRTRAYRVIVDNRPSGRIKRGETLTKKLDEGEHEVYVRVDWLRSNKLLFAIKPERREVRLVVRPRAKNGITGFLRSIFTPNEYLILEVDAAVDAPSPDA